MLPEGGNEAEALGMAGAYDCDGLMVDDDEPFPVACSTFTRPPLVLDSLRHAGGYWMA